MTRRVDVGKFFVLVHERDRFSDHENLAEGRRVDYGFEADAELSRFLAEIEGSSGQPLLLVVEDEYAMDTDAFLSFRPSWIRDGQGGVFYWMDLTSVTVDTAPGFIDENSSGHPTNAFVLRTSLQGLGVEGDEVRHPEQLVSSVATTLAAVVTAVFDKESFLVWIPGAE